MGSLVAPTYSAREMGERQKPLAAGHVVAIGAAALALAGAAIFNVKRARRAEQEHPATGKFVEVDGVRLHYLQRGEGRPLVLLHGNGASIGDMEASGLLDHAARTYRVIAFDRPGHGHSGRPRSTIWTSEAQAALIGKALRGMGVTRPIILGHSWGTLVALAMALDHTDEIAGLVLLSGYYFPTPRADALLLSPPAIPLVGDALRYTISPLIARLLLPAMERRIFAPSQVPDSFGRFPAGLSLRPSQLRASAAEAAMMISAARRLSRRYGELGMPIMILAGDGDKLATPKLHAMRLHELLPDSELILVPDAGHMIHYVATAGIIDAIDMIAAKTAIISSADTVAARQP
jgi:pimeloyl-ACP methyl ester carboxylesterase